MLDKTRNLQLLFVHLRLLASLGYRRFGGSRGEQE